LTTYTEQTVTTITTSTPSVSSPSMNVIYDQQEEFFARSKHYSDGYYDAGAYGKGSEIWEDTNS
tara:strand:- start:235 stop:426 length:192 start_codon:yes stop_codon:yes gene_type:complete